MCRATLAPSRGTMVHGSTAAPSCSAQQTQQGPAGRAPVCPATVARSRGQMVHGQARAQVRKELSFARVTALGTPAHLHKPVSSGGSRECAPGLTARAGAAGGRRGGGTQFCALQPLVRLENVISMKNADFQFADTEPARFALIMNTDVDECATASKGGCNQTCINTAGSYYCDCGTGYDVAGDGKGCVGTYGVLESTRTDS